MNLLQTYIESEINNAIETGMITDDKFSVEEVCQYINWDFLDNKLSEIVKDQIARRQPHIKVTKDTASCNYLINEDCYEVEIIKNTPPCDADFKIEMIDNQYLGITRRELKTLKEMLNNDKVWQFIESEEV